MILFHPWYALVSAFSHANSRIREIRPLSNGPSAFFRRSGAEEPLPNRCRCVPLLAKPVLTIARYVSVRGIVSELEPVITRRPSDAVVAINSRKHARVVLEKASSIFNQPTQSFHQSIKAEVFGIKFEHVGCRFVNMPSGSCGHHRHPQGTRGPVAYPTTAKQG